VDNDPGDIPQGNSSPADERRPDIDNMIEKIPFLGWKENPQAMKGEHASPGAF
jgi:hypothetical protein